MESSVPESPAAKTYLYVAGSSAKEKPAEVSFFLSFGAFQLCIQHKQQVESRFQHQGWVIVFYGFVENCSNHMCSFSYSLMMKNETKTTADEDAQKAGPWRLRRGD